MKRVMILAAIVLLLLPNIAVAAGSCTASTVARQAVLITTYTCTGDADGGTFPATASDVGLKGWVYAVDTYPGSTQPTDDYDITLTIAYGTKTIDVMGGALANRDTLNAERAYPVGTAFVNGPLTLNISGSSVNSAGITVVVYTYREP